MKIVVGVDWSEQAFATVQQVLHLYRPSELTLVHGVDLGIFEYPIVAQAANLQGYDDFRNSLIDAGRQVLARTANMLPFDSDTVKQVNEVGNPAEIILKTANAVEADLVAVGARGHSRVTELVLGSVSHRVLMHSTRPTLIVKGTSRPIQRVLVAIEGGEDAERIKQWLLVHPFANPVDLCVLSVVVPIRVADPYNIGGFETWSDSLKTYAEDLVKTVGAELMGSRYSISTRVATGEVAATVAEQAKGMDLVVVASHGRKGLERFLLGSASHGIVHHVTCPILVIR
ncbi:MAG TPA: universal stress protein [Nitrospira sp.]|nr:universal stress protein [Nitrospira sp.]